jgi:hypothetical protein
MDINQNPSTLQPTNYSRSRRNQPICVRVRIVFYGLFGICVWAGIFFGGEDRGGQTIDK